MQISIGKIINSQETLAILAKEKLPMKTSWRIKTIVDAIQPHVARFNALRDDLIKENGKEDENGNLAIDQNDKEAYGKFVKAINEVAMEEVEVDAKKINIDDLGDDLKMSLEELMVIEWLITE